MVCDIHAWLEVRSNGAWATPDTKEEDLYCTYDVFGLLFGVRNYANFTPLAPHRGLPADVTARVAADFDGWEGEAHSASWLHWADLEGMDRSQEPIDSRIHEFDASGTYVGKSTQSSALTSEDYLAIHQGGEVTKRGITYRQGKVKALANLPAPWERVFARMRAFATALGSENVRLVVWFDN